MNINDHSQNFHNLPTNGEMILNTVMEDGKKSAFVITGLSFSAALKYYEFFAESISHGTFDEFPVCAESECSIAVMKFKQASLSGISKIILISLNSYHPSTINLFNIILNGTDKRQNFDEKTSLYNGKDVMEAIKKTKQVLQLFGLGNYQDARFQPHYPNPSGFGFPPPPSFIPPGFAGPLPFGAAKQPRFSHHPSDVFDKCRVDSPEQNFNQEEVTKDKT